MTPGAIVADAALLPRGFGDAHLDAIIGWLSLPLDRLRVRDRLRELALAPWGDAAGDGALLRLAAGRAAVERLLAATPAIDALPPPELVIVAGGAWNVAPPPAVALAAADVIRRPGVRALGLDHARLLAPLGTIPDPGRTAPDHRRPARRAPAAAGQRPDARRPARGPPGGHARPARPGRRAALDLVPGDLELLDLPAGRAWRSPTCASATRSTSGRACGAPRSR